MLLHDRLSTSPDYWETVGNLQVELESSVRHIVGDHYDDGLSIEEVICFQQFLTLVLHHTLPRGVTWIVGQGLTPSQQHTLEQLRPFLASEKIIYPKQEDQKALFEAGVRQFTQVDTNSFQADVLMPQKETGSQEVDESKMLCQAVYSVLSKIAAQTDLQLFIKTPVFETKALKLTHHRMLLPIPIRMEVQVKHIERYKTDNISLDIAVRFFQEGECSVNLSLKSFVYEKTALACKKHQALEKAVRKYHERFLCSL